MKMGTFTDIIFESSVIVSALNFHGEGKISLAFFGVCCFIIVNLL
jgi:hypothetical protein